MQDIHIEYIRRYSLVRRLTAGGILCIALLSYLLTVEPTASFWDCPEYISVATGMQPGHPPGNPMWMLAARFFINFASEPQSRALAVNIMSCVCAALTIMLLFLTIEILVRRMLYPLTRPRAVLTLGSATVGALAMCWSDSFWFSAVEAEVYAFSALCTALLFYLSLLWLERRECPHSDRYLILIAYITGVSIGVHELNLLCLPVLILVVAYGLRKRLGVGKLLLTLFIGIASIGVVLYGLIPGFLKLAVVVELWCVNGMGLPFNSGAILTWITVLLLLTGASLFLHRYRLKARRTQRILRVCAWSLLMLFIGFSSYALIIIRSCANPPIDTGHPADILAFSSYFSRDQYGKAPLIYGAPFTAQPMRQRIFAKGDSLPSYQRYALRNPKRVYTQGITGMPCNAATSFAGKADSIENTRLTQRGGDRYLCTTYAYELSYPPELNMWFPRMHSHDPKEVSGYLNWIGANMSDMDSIASVTLAVDSSGKGVPLPKGVNAEPNNLRPSYLQNLQYFVVYQCAFMYWRYFMWNFSGRQNDYYGHGEPDAGNFITGFEVLDNLMLDVTSEAPANAGKGNKGRNVYYLLPLALGICGIIYQLLGGRRGRRQALAIFTLFVLTGIAIVVYLNQGPVQARDRDYSFLGSYYAFAIWIGTGTLLIYKGVARLMRHRPLAASITSVAIAICVPLQMLSQTADDHDRSGRTATPDYAYNMLLAVEPNSILFAADDNNIFPLWYMSETEEYRTDVRPVSLPYLGANWYTRQMYMPMRQADPLPLTIPKELAATSLLTFVRLANTNEEWTPALKALRGLYEDVKTLRPGDYPVLHTPRLYFTMGEDTIRIDMRKKGNGTRSLLLNYSDLILVDILATNAAQKTPRPIYWAATAGNTVLGGQLAKYLEQIGTVSCLNPSESGFNASKIASLANSYRYGGADRIPSPYFDPVAASAMARQRTAMLQAALSLARTGDKEDTQNSLTLIDKALTHIPAATIPYEAIPSSNTEEEEGVLIPADEGLLAAYIYDILSKQLENPGLAKKATDIRKARQQELEALEKYRNALRPAYRPYISIRLSNMLHNSTKN